MEIKEKKELKELTVKTYVAKDGATFDSYDACYRHETTLMKNEMQDYIDTKCIAQWCDCWGELPGFLNLGGNTIYLVVVDGRIVEWGKQMCNEDLGTYIGVPVFLSTDD